MKANFEIIYNELSKVIHLHPVIQELLEGLGENISTPKLVEKLLILESIRFTESSAFSWFFSEPEKLPYKNLSGLEVILDEPYRQKLREMPFDQTIFTLLSNLQNNLSSALDSRLYRQYQLSVNYDAELINESSVFKEYTETSQQIDYLIGSLALDLDRGVSFKIQGNEPISMNEYILDTEKKMNTHEETLLNKKNEIQTINDKIHTLNQMTTSDYISASELTEIDNDIAELIDQKKQTENSCKVIENNIKELKNLLDDKFNFILTFVEDKAKADILDRFGHQMILADLMREVSMAFVKNDRLQSSFNLGHQVSSQALHQVVLDKDHIYVDVHAAFDSGTDENGKICAFSINKRNLVWLDDPSIVAEKRGVFFDISARIELKEIPDKKGEYYMQVIAFQANSFTPDLIPNSAYLPERCIEINENMRSEYVKQIEDQITHSK